MLSFFRTNLCDFFPSELMFILNGLCFIEIFFFRIISIGNSRQLTKLIMYISAKARIRFSAGNVVRPFPRAWLVCSSTRIAGKNAKTTNYTLPLFICKRKVFFIQHLVINLGIDLIGYLKQTRFFIQHKVIDLGIDLIGQR